MKKIDSSDKVSQELIPAAKKWPELQNLVVELANKACSEINLRSPLLPADGMPYKQQCTLELLITELQRRV